MRNPNMILMINNVMEVYKEFCKDVCNEAGIHQLSFDIIMFLAEDEEIKTARDITNSKGIKKNIVSFHVDKLVNDGYIEREQMPEDRRQVRLSLTKKAEPVINRGREVQKLFCEYAMKGLTEDEIEIYKKCNQVFAENMAKLKLKIEGGKI